MFHVAQETHDHSRMHALLHGRGQEETMTLMTPKEHGADE
jgi:hypothetical protein